MGNHVASIPYNSTFIRFGLQQSVTPGSYPVLFRPKGTVGSTHSSTSCTLKTKDVSSVFPGSSGWTLMRKKRVPNLAAPFDAASSRYMERNRMVRGPKMGQKASSRRRESGRHGGS